MQGKPIVDILLPGKEKFKVSQEDCHKIIPEVLKGASNVQVLAVDHLERELPRPGDKRAEYFLIRYDKNNHTYKAWLPIKYVSKEKIAIEFI